MVRMLYTNVESVRNSPNQQYTLQQQQVRIMASARDFNIGKDSTPDKIISELLKISDESQRSATLHTVLFNLSPDKLADLVIALLKDNPNDFSQNFAWVKKALDYYPVRWNQLINTMTSTDEKKDQFIELLTKLPKDARQHIYSKMTTPYQAMSEKNKAIITTTTAQLIMQGAKESELTSLEIKTKDNPATLDELRHQVSDDKRPVIPKPAFFVDHKDIAKKMLAALPVEKASQVVHDIYSHSSTLTTEQRDAIADAIVFTLDNTPVDQQPALLEKITDQALLSSVNERCQQPAIKDRIQSRINTLKPWYNPTGWFSPATPPAPAQPRAVVKETNTWSTEERPLEVQSYHFRGNEVTMIFSKSPSNVQDLLKALARSQGYKIENSYTIKKTKNGLFEVTFTKTSTEIPPAPAPLEIPANPVDQRTIPGLAQKYSSAKPEDQIVLRKQLAGAILSQIDRNKATALNTAIFSLGYNWDKISDLVEELLKQNPANFAWVKKGIETTYGQARWSQIASRMATSPDRLAMFADVLSKQTPNDRESIYKQIVLQPMNQQKKTSIITAVATRVILAVGELSKQEKEILYKKDGTTPTDALTAELVKQANSENITAEFIKKYPAEAAALLKTKPALIIGITDNAVLAAIVEMKGLDQSTKTQAQAKLDDLNGNIISRNPITSIGIIGSLEAYAAIVCHPVVPLLLLADYIIYRSVKGSPANAPKPAQGDTTATVDLTSAEANQSQTDKIIDRKTLFDLATSQSSTNVSLEIQYRNVKPVLPYNQRLFDNGGADSVGITMRILIRQRIGALLGLLLANHSQDKDKILDAILSGKLPNGITLTDTENTIFTEILNLVELYNKEFTFQETTSSGIRVTPPANNNDTSAKDAGETADGAVKDNNDALGGVKTKLEANKNKEQEYRAFLEKYHIIVDQASGSQKHPALPEDIKSHDNKNIILLLKYLYPDRIADIENCEKNGTGAQLGTLLRALTSGKTLLDCIVCLEKRLAAGKVTERTEQALKYIEFRQKINTVNTDLTNTPATYRKNVQLIGMPRMSEIMEAYANGTLSESQYKDLVQKMEDGFTSLEKALPNIADPAQKNRARTDLATYARDLEQWRKYEQQSGVDSSWFSWVSGSYGEDTDKKNPDGTTITRKYDHTTGWIFFYNGRNTATTNGSTPLKEIYGKEGAAWIEEYLGSIKPTPLGTNYKILSDIISMRLDKPSSTADADKIKKYNEMCKRAQTAEYIIKMAIAAGGLPEDQANALQEYVKNGGELKFIPDTTRKSPDGQVYTLQLTINDPTVPAKEKKPNDTTVPETPPAKAKTFTLSTFQITEPYLQRLCTEHGTGDIGALTSGGNNSEAAANGIALLWGHIQKSPDNQEKHELKTHPALDVPNDWTKLGQTYAAHDYDDATKGPKQGKNPNPQGIVLYEINSKMVTMAIQSNTSDLERFGAVIITDAGKQYDKLIVCQSFPGLIKIKNLETGKYVDFYASGGFVIGDIAQLRAQYESLKTKSGSPEDKEKRELAEYVLRLLGSICQEVGRSSTPAVAVPQK